MSNDIILIGSSFTVSFVTG